MKTLHLVRHAKSSWKDLNKRDHDRPLNKRGKINAKFMAELFVKEEAAEYIVTSTAVRAKKTAERFAKSLGIKESQFWATQSAYHAGSDSLLNLIHNIDDQYDSAMLFGHNPGITSFAEFLDNNYHGYMVTCARVSIQFEVDSWQLVDRDMGSVVADIYPRQYPEMADL